MKVVDAETPIVIFFLDNRHNLNSDICFIKLHWFNHFVGLAESYYWRRCIRATQDNFCTVPGVPKKEEQRIFSTLQSKSVICFYIIKQSIFRRREWYQDHWIWLSNFDSIPISWNTVIFKFRLIFATDEHCVGNGLSYAHFRYAVSFVDTDQWASPNHHMKGLSRYT